MIKSWKTTILGLIALLSALSAGIDAYSEDRTLDASEARIVVGLAVAGLGLLVARDGDKTSEDVGAKR